jgi:ABC-type glycerol-3-phosphate transport system substrate-binding protein
MGSALILVGASQLALAQPPGGGGGRGNMMTFDAINMADANGNKDDHLTLDEVRHYFEEMMAARGGGGGGGGRFGGAGGGQDFVANMFSSWDTQPEGGDGMVTEEEFNNRPQGRGGFGGGRGGQQ